jgi:hypothetical protein
MSAVEYDGPGEEDGPWADGWLLRSIGPGATNENMARLYHAANAVTARIGMLGEIDSRHPLTLDLLEALNAVKP